MRPRCLGSSHSARNSSSCTGNILCDAAVNFFSGKIFSEEGTIPVYSKHLEGHPIEAVLKLRNNYFHDIFDRTPVNAACYFLVLLGV